MLYIFEDCRLNIDLRTLQRAGTTLRLRLQVFKVLLYLLENRHRVVSKQELAENAWPVPIITDSAVEATIRDIRRAVGDNIREQRVIATLPRHGYRFIASLSGPLEDSEAARHQGDAAPVEETSTTLTESLTRPDITDSESPQSTRQCLACGTVSVPASARFCLACGTALPMHCPSCGETLQGPARFCSTCGASLHKPTATTDAAPTPLPSNTEPAPLLPPVALATGLSAPDAERRQLTVMFCDLVDATTLSGTLDPEDYLDVLRAYHATCQNIMRQFDGSIAQHLRDGLLVYFGHPRAHEDDAHRAVRAALGLLQALEPLQRRFDQQTGIQLAIRLGIHTGVVIVGEMGGEAHPARLAIGQTPTVAIRLQTLAAPNTVVISATTAHLVQGYFVCHDLGLHTLQGVAEPQQLFRILQPTQAQSRLDVVEAKKLTPLVGRSAEVTFLLERWSQAKDGIGQVIELYGEAGIGKSRLVQVMKGHLRDEDYARLECRCSPYHQHSTFYPLIDLCQRVFQLQPDETPETQWHKLASTLTRFDLPGEETLALFAALVSLSGWEARLASLHLTPPQQRQRTLETLLNIMMQVATQQPLLFVVEDLHWIDPSTLKFLSLLVDQAPTMRLCLVLTSRSTFRTPWVGRTHLTQVTLPRLSRLHVEQMVGHVLAGKSLPATVRHRVVEQTDGVPLFVEEMTKAIIESQMLDQATACAEETSLQPSMPIPTTLHDSLMARLDRLGPAKSLAQLGATMGRQFPFALLQAVTQQDPESLQRGLQPLLEAELVYQQGLPPRSTYIFKHALIQEIAYQSLVKSTRQQYHQRIVTALMEQFQGMSATHPEVLAHHYTEANLVEQAIPYWQQAGQQAIERSANTEAISHLTTALELLHTLPDTLARAQRELTLQLTLGAPLMMLKGYSSPEVERVYMRARELCKHVENGPHFFSMLSGLRRVHLNRAEFDMTLALGQQHLQLAQHLQDPAQMLQGHMALGITLFHLGNFPQALTHLQQGLTFFDSQHPPTAAFDPMVLSLSYLARVLWHLGYPDQALEKSRQALALARQSSKSYTLGSALHVVSMLHKERREPHIVQEQAEMAITLGREHNFVRWVGGGLIRKGWALVQQDLIEGGLEQLRQGVDIWRDLGRLGLPQHLAMLAEAYAKAERPEAGLQSLSEAFAVSQSSAERYYDAELYRLQADLFMQSRPQRTDHDTAESLLKGLAIARQQQARSQELRVAISLSAFWLQQNKPAEARQVLSTIYDQLTEGFDTQDMQEAQQLLHVL